MKLELVFVPVTNVDRAKAFYEKVGFSVDHDNAVDKDVRFVQMTPPGSACSIAFGTGLTSHKPGSLNNVLLVVDNAQQAHDELTALGIDATPVEDQGWGKFVGFSDPDGNEWALQELPKPTA